MKSTLEALEGHQVRLSVEIDEGEFDRAVDDTARKIGRSVRIPGFRPGKVPLTVIKSRIGMDEIRRQAIADSAPEYITRGVREHDIDLVAPPTYEALDGDAHGPVTFVATCHVRPLITVPGYDGLRVELLSPALTDAQFDEALKGELRRGGRLEDTSAASVAGDHVVIDLAAARDGKDVAGLNVEDWTYEVGQGWVAPGFDEALTGKSPGDIIEFTAVPNGTEAEADFTVKVLKVQRLVLPDLTDEWVSENCEGHTTVEGWTSSLRSRIEEARLETMRRTVVDRLTDALAALVVDDAPEVMVEMDLRGRLENVMRQFSQQGIDLAQWLSATGQDAEGFLAGLRGQSHKAVKVDLALRAVATAEAIEATDDDIDGEIAAAAERFDEDEATVRRAYEANDGLVDLRARIRTSKALDWLLHRSTFVDENGATLDTVTVLGEAGEDHGHAGHHDEGGEAE